MPNFLLNQTEICVEARMDYPKDDYVIYGRKIIKDEKPIPKNTHKKGTMNSVGNYQVTDNPVVKGDLDKIPKKESNVVRIFISSTFTDMTEERNALMKSTFPELQTYFRTKGLDFEVVDMRWGVREEMVLDHMASELCEKEIHQAQKISNGVSFIALLGDKYGSCPLPSSMSFQHYQWFVSVLKQAKINADLLESWYILDENCRKSVDEKPSVYVLCPLTDKYKFINSTDPDKAELRFQQRNQWQVDENNLRKLLQTAATLCHDKGMLTEQEKHHYFTAVTEREILTGILTDNEASLRSLCFIRTFEHFVESDELANRFSDVLPMGKVDPICRLHLKNLISKKIPDKLQLENIFHYSIPWHSKGVCPHEDVVHRNYISKLCDDVKRAVIELTEKRMKTRQKNIQLNFDTIWYSDLLHHAEFCCKESQFTCQRKYMCHCIKALTKYDFKTSRPKFLNDWDAGLKLKNVEKFQDFENNGRDDFLDKANNGMEYFDDYNNEENKNSDGLGIENETESFVSCNKPVVVYGPSGSGKTALVASLTKNFVELYNGWINNRENYNKKPINHESIVKVVRFLGTSPMSCTIRELLLSVITQLWEAFGIDSNLHKSIFNSSFSNLCNYFEQLLWSFQNYQGKILITLDAIDQLSPEDGAYSMNWIPLTFPNNVFVLISVFEVTNLNETTTNDPSAICLQNLQKILPDERCYVKIHALSMDTAKNIFKSFNQKINHCLTSQQKNLIFAAIKNCAQPLYLKLLIELTKDWKSFTDVSNFKFGKTCKEVIQQLFDKLATQHGRTLVYSLKYMTAARAGLTDVEVEDLLSLDDEVLQDVYVYHLPADNTIIRLPPTLWRRIRQQLSEYLTDKEADGKIVVTWYHRQFWEAAKFHAANNVRVHTVMAEYFNGDWHGKAKPLTLYKGKKAEYSDCSRNAPPMPNCFTENEPNLRKLNELPYHLIMSYQIDQSADLLTDFDFLLCKLKWMGLKSILKDFRLFIDTFAAGSYSTADLAYFKLAKTYKEANHLMENFSEQIIEMKILLEILISASDSLKQDYSSLGAQIYGRLSGIWLTFPRIRVLYKQTKNWMNTTDIPLIIPRFACLQEPGTYLRMTICNTTFIPRRIRDSRSGFYFNGRYLFIREQNWNEFDKIQVYDLDNFGEQIQTIKMQCQIISAHFFANEKFVIAKTFSQPKNQQSNKIDILLNLQTKERVELPIDPQIIHQLILSHSEQILVAIYSKTCTFFDVVNQGFSVKLNAEIESETDFVTASFSLDDVLLVIMNEGGQIFNYDIEKTKLLWTVSLAPNAERSELNFEKFQFHFMTDRRIVFRGIQPVDMHRLYTVDPENGNVLNYYDGDTYRLDIILIHKSEQWIAAATTVDEVIGKVRSKPIFVWDIETGEGNDRRFKGNKGAIKSATFLGEDDQYLAFSRQFDPAVLIVHIGTPDKPNRVGRLLLRLNAHVKPAVSFIKDPTDNVLVSVSEDNQLKVWDLYTIMTICKLYVDYPHIHISQYDDQDDSDGKSRKYAATGCLFGRITFFDLLTGDFIAVQGQSKQVKRMNGIIFARNEFGFPDCDEIVICSAAEPNITIWDPVTGKCLKSIPTDVVVFHVELNKSIIYVGGDDFSKRLSVIRTFDIVTGIQTHKFMSHQSFCVQYFPSTGSLLSTFSCNERFVFDKFTFVSEKNLICAWNKIKIVVFEAIDNGFVEKTLSSNGGTLENPVDKCVFIIATFDARYVLCGVYHFLHIVDLETLTNEAKKVTVLNFDTTVNCLDVTEDSQHALVGCYRVVKIVHIASGQEVSQIWFHNDFVEAVKISLGRYIVTLSKDKNLHIHEFDTTTFKCQKLVTFTFHCPVRHLAVAEDLSFILVGPESAAPLAILTFNDALVKRLKSVTPNFLGCLTCKYTDEGEEVDEKNKNNLQPKNTKIKFNNESINFYVDDNLSLSLNKTAFETCKSICSPLSSVSSSTDDKTCHIL